MPAIEENCMRLSISIDQHLPNVFFMDLKLLEFIMFHVLQNAIENCY